MNGKSLVNAIVKHFSERGIGFWETGKLSLTSLSVKFLGCKRRLGRDQESSQHRNESGQVSQLSKSGNLTQSSIYFVKRCIRKPFGVNKSLELCQRYLRWIGHYSLIND